MYFHLPFCSLCWLLQSSQTVSNLPFWFYFAQCYCLVLSLFLMVPFTILSITAWSPTETEKFLSPSGCLRLARTAVPSQWGLGPCFSPSEEEVLYPFFLQVRLTRCPRSCGGHTGEIIWGFVSRSCSRRTTCLPVFLSWDDEVGPPERCQHTDWEWLQ